MKKSIIFMSFALALTGCSDTEPQLQLNDPMPSEIAAQTSVRSINEVIEIANTLADAIDGEACSRASRRRASTPKSVFTYNTHSSRAISDTLIYIVNYDHESGYAIIAAPENIDPILGFVENGAYGNFESTNNDGLQMFLSAAENYVSTQGIDGFEIYDPDRPIIKPDFTEWTTLVNDTIVPRVKVNWGQHLPEGYYCPNGIAGCVQTALAQIMSSFEWPERINLTYEGRDANSQPLDWNEIKKHVNSIYVKPEEVSLNNAFIQLHLSACSTSLSNHLALGRLCRQLGQLDGAIYGEKATGAPAMTAARSTAELLLNNKLSIGSVMDISTQNVVTLFNNMKEKDGILYMEGTDNNSKNRHAWIMDGGLQVGSYTTRVYSTGIGIDGSGPTTFTTYNLTTLFHFNWGWNGTGNGYFLPDVYQPKNAEKLDQVYNGYTEETNYNISVNFFAIRQR